MEERKQYVGCKTFFLARRIIIFSVVTYPKLVLESRKTTKGYDSASYQISLVHFAHDFFFLNQKRDAFYSQPNYVTSYQT